MESNVPTISNVVSDANTIVGLDSSGKLDTTCTTMGSITAGSSFNIRSAYNRPMISSNLLNNIDVDKFYYYDNRKLESLILGFVELNHKKDGLIYKFNSLSIISDILIKTRSIQIEDFIQCINMLESMQVLILSNTTTYDTNTGYIKTIFARSPISIFYETTAKINYKEYYNYIEKKLINPPISIKEASEIFETYREHEAISSL